MYKVGDLIVYGCEGACRVESLEKLNVAGIDHEKLYYNLSPVYHMGNIFAPVDTKQYMRPIIKHEEAQRLINLIPSIKANVVINQSRRMLEDHYNNYFQTHECIDLIRILKSVYLKGIAVALDRKKIGAIDERFKKKAEDLLYGELAIALKIPKDDVSQYIESKIQEVGIDAAAV